MDISSLGWDLAELEAAARLVVEEEERQDTSGQHPDNPPRTGDDGLLVAMGTATPPVELTDQGEGLEAELARRLTLGPLHLIEEISTSQSESTSEESDESEEDSDSSNQSPPPQPTASNQFVVESGKGECPHTSQFATEQHK